MKIAGFFILLCLLPWGFAFLPSGVWVRAAPLMALLPVGELGALAAVQPELQKNPETAQECVTTHCPYGMPVIKVSRGKMAILPNTGYVSGYCLEVGNPLWVASKVKAVITGTKGAKRPETFSPDPRLPEAFQVKTEMFIRSGYQRGHMAPNSAISLNWGRQAQIESFLLTNVVPQTQQTNEYLWETLEKLVLNRWAKRFGTVWTVAGPVFTGQRGTLPGTWVQIPDAYYKVIIHKEVTGTKILCFIMPADAPPERQDVALYKYQVSMRDVQNATGLEFHPNLPTEERARLLDDRASRLW